MTKNTSIKMIAILVTALLLVPFIASIVPGQAAQDASTTIQLGDFFFQGPEGKTGPFDQPEVNIATITGASSGEIVITLQNNGKVEHEVLSPLFMLTNETSTVSFDSAGNQVSRVETVGSLREVAIEPGLKTEITLSLDEATFRSFEDDPNHALQFEIECFVGHGTSGDHYKLGMRGFITLKP
ncbi:hypothetical protein HY229_08175 [Candidatus Acetothermia bacterium]|nr:hypothetical protein [Candidatus Acetothermia bacterium]MBI3644057.1 hypothetical protein [Candidatus Acetothermia bacterium]